jgi:hypothetical protein
MRNFILGVVITLLVLLLGGLAIATLGFLPTNADTEPPKMERHIAMSAMDASMERHAPRLTSPVPPTDENLIDGMKIYTTNCALCHGGLDHKPSALEKSFYPPPPQMIIDQDMWKVTAFLTRIEKLPPAVQDYWKKSTGVAPPAVDPQGEGHGHHD